MAGFQVLTEVFLAKSNRLRFQDSQQLEVKSAKWQPGSGELKSLEVFGDKLTDEEINRLRALGLKGSVTIAGSGIYGSGPAGTNEGRPHAYVLIVLQRPLKESVNLAQPDRTNVIYVQTDEGLTMYPSDANVAEENSAISRPKRPRIRYLVYG